MLRFVILKFLGTVAKRIYSGRMLQYFMRPPEYLHTTVPASYFYDLKATEIWFTCVSILQYVVYYKLYLRTG